MVSEVIRVEREAYIIIDCHWCASWVGLSSLMVMLQCSSCITGCLHGPRVKLWTRQILGLDFLWIYS